MRCARLTPSLLAALSLFGVACGSGTVGLGEDPGTDDDCPTLVASTDRLEFLGGWFDAPILQSLEIDNRCVGATALTLEIAEITGDADAFLLPDGAVTVQPGARLTMDVSFLATGYEPVEAQVRFTTNDAAMPELIVTLAGTAATDQDADGYDAVEVGGTDCDDGDASVHPGRDERDDGVDQDCDGLVDEDYLRPGDLVISEIFTRPAFEPTSRQWFEVENRSERAIDLVNFELVTPESTLRVPERAVLPPGARGVLARTDNVGSIGMTEPALAVLEGADRVTLVGSWTLAVMAGDEVVYELDGSTFPRVEEGRSIQLDPTIDNPLQTTRGNLWCQATSEIATATGERATPGGVNDWCGQVDHDGDGVPLSRDCDDTDPKRNPDADEVLDGIDNNCDDSIDRLELPDDATGYVTGMDGGRSFAMSSGDFNGDGRVDLLVADASTRRVKLMQAHDLRGETGAFGSRSIDEAFLSTVWIVDAAPTGVDIDGDAIDDLVLGMQGYDSTPYFARIVTSARVDRTDISIIANSGEGRDRNGVATVDTDGDGVYEVLAGLSDGSTRAGEAWLLDVDGLTDGTYRHTALSDGPWTGAGDFSGLGMFVGAGDLDGDGYEDLMIRTGERYRRRPSRVWVIGGGVRMAPPGRIDSAADGWAAQAAYADLNFQVGRPMIADLDDDGTMDMVVPGGTGTYVYYDVSDRLAGGREADLEIQAPGGGVHCGATIGDIDGDDTGELLIGWSDAAWGGTYRVSLYTSDTFSSGSRSIRASDDDGSIRTDSAATDFFGCGLYAADLAGSGNDDIVAMSPTYRGASGVLASRLWYFESN